MPTTNQGRLNAQANQLYETHQDSNSLMLDDCSNIVGPSDHYSIHPFDQQAHNHHQYNEHTTKSKVQNLSKHNNIVNNRQPLPNRSNDLTSNNPLNQFQILQEDKFNVTQQNHRSNIYGHLSANETKICVIVDSRTPVIIKTPVPTNSIKLSDFKTALPALDNPNFKYFFKSSDSEFGIVKEEIQDNNARLPVYKGRVVAWIVTPGGLKNELSSSAPKSDNLMSNLTYSQTSYEDSYDETSSAMTTTGFETSSYFTETNDDCSSTFSETTCDTFISQKRAYQKPVDETRNSDHKRNIYGGSKHRLIDNRSSSSSASSSSSSLQSDASPVDDSTVLYVTVHLVLTAENFLGLQISSNTNNGIDEGISIDAVTEGSEVARDGRIEPGDKLVQVNDVNLEELTNDDAVAILKAAVIKRGPLKLVVAKYVESAGNRPDGLIGVQDTVQPIDTAAWVAHTQALTINHDHSNSAASSPSFESFGHDTADFVRPTSKTSAKITGLHKTKTSILDMVQFMKMPDYGLDIRNREWLKISIPCAFIGSDLVAWLQRNVYGFTGQRDAKKYARRMLKDSIIKDPLSNRVFNKKSYYIFVV